MTDDASVIDPCPAVPAIGTVCGSGGVAGGAGIYAAPFEAGDTRDRGGLRERGQRPTGTGSGHACNWAGMSNPGTGGVVGALERASRRLRRHRI